MEVEGVAGTAFLVWAPNARRVSVVGDFNGWDGRRHPMRKRVECGVWELFVPGLARGRRSTSSRSRARSGELLPLKADPLAFAAEHPPRTGSVVAGLGEPRLVRPGLDGRARGRATRARRRSRSTSATSAPGCGCPSTATAT